MATLKDLKPGETCIIPNLGKVKYIGQGFGREKFYSIIEQDGKRGTIHYLGDVII